MQHTIKQAIQLYKKDNLAAAQEICESILKQDADNHTALHLLGVIIMKHSGLNEATKHIEKAIKIAPSNAEYFHNCSYAYRQLGELDKARQYLQQSIKLKPDYGESYQALAEITRYTEKNGLLDAIEQQLKKNFLFIKEASFFHFAAGKLYDDLGDYDRAFEHFSLGNKRSKVQFDRQQYEKKIKDIIYTYNYSYLEKRLQEGLAEELPVFIVGMPRSGSTLVEQVLASHSQVFGAGEIDDIHTIAETMGKRITPHAAYPDFMHSIPAPVLNGFAQSYITRMKGLFNNANVTRVINKQLMNFQYIGLISELFPKARIIHIRRNPLDTCLSCFFQNFSNGVAWSFNLDHLGRFYLLYQRMMEHWRHGADINMIEIDYEDLVNNQEDVSRKIIDSCGLKWQKNCLEFNKTKREVSTASFWQVRQPLYDRSISRWQNYEKHLEPLIRILGRNQ